MNKIMFSLLILVLLLSSLEAQVTELHNLGYVVVSPNGPDDGGDYGPHTPDTQTSGMQEAFDYAKDNAREVYIVGGAVDGSGEPVVYDLDATLTIPWGQDWHCDGGNYVMRFSMASGDCLVIDSQMNCLFRFGIISAPNLQSGSIVKIEPTTVGPDDFIVCTCCVIKISAILGSGDTIVGKGTGLHLFASTGGIVFNDISVGEIVGCERGIHVYGGLNNTIKCPLVRRCNTHLHVDWSEYSQLSVLMDPNNIGGTVVGAQISAGKENIYNLAWQGNFDPGNALVFGGAARDNIVYAMGLPTNGVTNNATIPTNRIVPTKPVGFGVGTPTVPATDTYEVNRVSYSVVVTILTPGLVSSWSFRDSNSIEHTISGSLLAGQSIYLEPGDGIKFNYLAGGAPTWAWRALR